MNIPENIKTLANEYSDAEKEFETYCSWDGDKLVSRLCKLSDIRVQAMKKLYDAIFAYNDSLHPDEYFAKRIKYDMLGFEKVTIDDLPNWL